MNSESSMNSILSQASSLRKRAESRLKEELSKPEESARNDIGRQLYELRINQIEIELLTEEFSKMRQRISPVSDRHQASDSSGHGYFFLDQEGNIRDAHFTAPHPGAGGNRWSGRSLTQLVAVEQREQFRDYLREVFISDKLESCELSFDQSASKELLGVKLPLYALIKTVVDDEKKLCLAVVEDISNRKIAEKREKASNAALTMLNRAIAASRNEIFMFDAKTLNFTFANQRALENLGYSMDELKWLTPADIQAHVFNQEMSNHITHLLNHKQSVRRFNAVHLRRDCSMYPVEIYLQFFERDTDGYFIAIALDTSNQTAVESKLKSIIESADAIIWAAKIDSRLEFLSDQIRDILGYSADQFIGAPMLSPGNARYIHRSDRKKLVDAFRQVAKGGNKVSDLRCRARQADGEWRWFSLNMTPNRAVTGEITQVVGVMHDIHARKLAEDALLKLNQELDSRVQQEIKRSMEKDLLLQRQSRLAAMGEMIGNIAHQWRQPINTLGLILSDLEDAAMFGECDLDYIQNAVAKSKYIIQKMSSTIDDFRHFFRADKSVGPFSLRHVTDECLNLVDAALKNNSIEVIINCERDVQVNGYANEYSQALMNILNNSREAIVGKKAGGGRIVIEIGEENGLGVHTITDNGGGIPPEIMPRIFEPHFTTKEKGVGIGLYMTLISIEKNMHGHIAVQNVTDGVRFTLHLPKA